MMVLKMDKLELTVSFGFFLLVRLNLFLDEIGKYLKYILKWINIWMKFFLSILEFKVILKDVLYLYGF